MEDRFAALAVELLRLEQAHQTREFDDAEEVRWQHLVGQLFKEERQGGRHRRSFRISCEANVLLSTESAKLSCSVQDVSLVGLSLAGAELATVRHGDVFMIQSIEINGAPAALALECKAARIYLDGPVPRIGAEITAANSPETLNRFIQRVHYPLYIRYLERISGSLVR